MKNMGKIGRYGEFGGQYVPETVMNAVNELNNAYEKYKNDPGFTLQLPNEAFEHNSSLVQNEPRK